MYPQKMKTFLVVFLLCGNVYGQSGVSHVTSTFKDAFDSTGLVILGVGTVATVAAASQDSAMHDSWRNHQRMSHDLSRFGDFWGSGIPQGILLLGQLAFDKDKFWPSFEGVASSIVVTQALKFSTARARPDSTTRTSFPSGHSQISFAHATTVLMSYGWKYSIPFYGTATITALSRLADNAHWFSDVVAGAAVGILFGRAGFKHHFSVAPMDMAGESGFGLTFSVSI